MNARYHQWLRELTSLPTAAGQEQRVEQWLERMFKRRFARRGAKLARDRWGNIVIDRPAQRGKKPICLEAHMDHPAFVVDQDQTGRTIEAGFRGGVGERFFAGTPVLLHTKQGKPQRGVVRELRPAPPAAAGLGDKQAAIDFEAPVKAPAGTVLTWDLPPAEIKGDRLTAPACDDLAGVAAALAAFDTLISGRDATDADVRLLLTRAEELAFIGAIAACKGRTLPRSTRFICLENSKSFAESPIGGGPIVRVGDRASTFDADLTYRFSRIAEAIAQEDPAFKWQRKLMPGGTCEASAFQAYGYISTCLCLPLGNYHNMNEKAGRIDSETISLSDFDGLVRLLVESVRRLDDPKQSPTLRARLEDLFAARRGVL